MEVNEAIENCFHKVYIKKRRVSLTTQFSPEASNRDIKVKKTSGTKHQQCNNFLVFHSISLYLTGRHRDHN